MAKEQTKPGDPEYGVFQTVAQWNNTMECIPAWEEILEYEYVRQRGEINMITEDVQRYAFDRGLYALVTWIQRCKDARISPVSLYSPTIAMYEKDHGPREKWITEDIRLGFEALELENQERELRRRLREVQEKRSRAGAKRSR